MKIILIGKNENLLRKIKDELNKFEYVSTILTVEDESQAIAEIMSIKADVIFIDIDNQGAVSLETVKVIQDIAKGVEIVFMFENNKLLVDICELKSIYFITKSFSTEELSQLITKLLKKTSVRLFDNILCRQSMTVQMGKVAVMKETQILLKSEKDICFFYVDSGKVYAVMGEDSVFWYKNSLSYLEERLSDRFFRCHKNYLVNIEKVLEIIPWFNSTIKLKLESYGDTVPVSRKYVKEFKLLVGL